MRYFIAAGREYIHELGVDKKYQVVPLDSQAQINLVQLMLGYEPTDKSSVYDATEFYGRVINISWEQRFYDTGESLGIKPRHLESLIYRELGFLADMAKRNNLQILFMIKYDETRACF